MNYFEQTEIGRSVWWSWIFAFWTALILWIIGQSILIGSLTSLAASQSPDIGRQLMNAQRGMLSESSEPVYANLLLTSSLIVLAALIGVAATTWIANSRSIASKSSSTLTISVWLTLSGILASTWLYMRGNAMLDGTDYMAAMQSAMGLSPTTFALFLLTFPVGCLGLYLMQTLIHRRSVLSLHTAASRIRWSRILEGFGLSWLVLGAFVGIGGLTGLMELEQVFTNERFWGFAVVSLLLIPLQAGAEEVVFRGYLNQGLTHFTRNKWVAFGVTSFAFMAMHLSNPEALEGAAAGTLPIVMSGYLFFGFAMCVLVWLDDGLETAIGVHAGNNCFAAIFVNYEGSVLPTPSVFLAKPDAVSDSLTTILFLAVVVAVIWWRRKGPLRG